jgi:hypothetical protein
MELATVDSGRPQVEDSSEDESSSSDDYADIPSGPIDPEKCLASGPGLAGGAARKFWLSRRIFCYRSWQLILHTRSPFIAALLQC